MLPTRTNALILAGLASLAVSLACLHEARTLKVDPSARSFSLLETLLGESRRLFANHFFVKADAYFHSGYYPTIFDQQEAFQTAHFAVDAGLVEEKNMGDEHSFMGAPRDFLERFSRNFFPAEHTHLDTGGAASAGHEHHGHSHGHSHGDEGEEHEADAGTVREILPWLKLSAALDPGRIETYTVTAYWLRNQLKRSREAEEVLRDGLRLNPRDPAILFELGRIFWQDREDVTRARNVFEAGIDSWQVKEGGKEEPNTFLLLQLVSHLAELEEKAGNDDRSIELWEQAKGLSPNPAGPQKHIDDIRAKAAADAAK